VNRPGTGATSQLSAARANRPANAAGTMAVIFLRDLILILNLS
jgi:hypothetical protein